MNFAPDLALQYADFGQSVVYTPLGGGATVTALAILDQPGQVLIGGEVLATDYSLRYPTASFPAVKRGDTFTTAGVTYTVRESAQNASVDGLEQIVVLSRN